MKLRFKNILLLCTIVQIVLIPHLTVRAQTENTPQSGGIPFYIVATIIGGIIIITLTYVSWKKYRAERKNKKENDNS